jgi:hypothetical protein
MREVFLSKFNEGFKRLQAFVSWEEGEAFPEMREATTTPINE